ncbi:crotonase/enoyl-CoA hydratase family protein [Phytohabitans suffuscus]|uniref:Enoyl-CoA hydratase n=1 Tax=Phytohabitans suffuscus TaxID=624315 RepID=A0A6F8YCS1_9ACTN|nr:crotonase/enoyl-CoA hydratase family protein [Phytohabitans suffuscus]BCB83896.1 enoyl-CoA hydratase [Phytohabitans suffuscus]
MSVLVERHDRVLVATINRPEARNAINTAAAEGIAAALTELDESDDLSVGVLTGAGKGFCAGMDLKAFLAGERPAVPGRGFAGIVERPPAKPLIAAVEGFAVAGGFEIALACDLIVAAEDATFGLPEVRRGLLPGGGGLLRLPTRVPYAVALEWILTGRRVTAREAHAAGLVSRLAGTGTALATALDLAREIARNAPLAVRAAKRIVVESPSWPAGEAFARQREIYEPVRSSQDAIEGARAFTEKREPNWRGA